MVKESTKSKLKKFVKRAKSTASSIGRDLSSTAKALGRYSTPVAQSISSSFNSNPQQKFNMPQRQNYPQQRVNKIIRIVNVNGIPYYMDNNGVLYPVKRRAI